MLESESDWLLARHLYPAQRVLYRNQMAISALRGEFSFEFGESGHPTTLAEFLLDLYGGAPSRSEPSQTESCSSTGSTETLDTAVINEFFSHSTMEQPCE